MDEYKRRRIVLSLLLGLSLVTILVLAGGLPDLQFRSGKSLNLIEWFFAELAQENPTGLPEIVEVPSGYRFLPEIGDLMLKSMIAVFWLMSVFSIVMFFVSPRFRRDLLRMLAFIIPLVILLPQIAKAMTEQPTMGEEAQASGYALGEAAFPQPPDFIQNPPEWLFLIINALLIFIILGGIFYLWRRLRPISDERAVVVKEVRRALSNLESGSALKNVVIVCYTQMCQGLQESQQIKRHRAMTPREFENHLSNAGIASTHIQQLTRLFESVRYGAQQTDVTTENEAKRCLQSILEVYGE